MYAAYDIRRPICDIDFLPSSHLSLLFHVSDSELRHPMPVLRQQFFRSGREKFGWQVNLDVCLQNIEKVWNKFAVVNRPSDVVSRIYV